MARESYEAALGEGGNVEFSRLGGGGEGAESSAMKMRTWVDGFDTRRHLGLLGISRS